MRELFLNIKKLNEDATIPTYGSDYAAGMDIYSSEDTFVQGLCSRVVKTGISVSWTGKHAESYYLRIAPRSGLAAKHGIFVNAGVIDYDYRGEVKVVLYNSEEADFNIRKGDRIAQIILEKITRPTVMEVDVHEDEETGRGAGGFGSTGR